MNTDREQLMKEAMAMPFRFLPDEYSVTGIKYKQLVKGEKGAIYKEVGGNSYEVFKLKIAKPNVVMGVAVPERERTPGNEDFGVWAWCVSAEEKARKIFEEIESGQRDYIEE